MSISKKTRFEIFKRDGFRCLYCGQVPPAVILEVDHVVPVSKGGADDEHNLATSCFACNRGKSGNGLSQLPSGHHDTIDQRREKLEQLQAITELTLELKKHEEIMFQIVSDRWITLDGNDPEEFCLSGEPESAVRRFLKLLPLPEVIEAVDISFSGGRSKYQQFKFFCGICWRKIKNPLSQSVPTKLVTQSRTPPVDSDSMNHPASLAAAFGQASNRPIAPHSDCSDARQIENPTNDIPGSPCQCKND